MENGMTGTSLTIVFVIIAVFIVIMLLFFITAKTKEGYVDYKSTHERNQRRFQKYQK